MVSTNNTAKMLQTKERLFKSLWIILVKNPVILAGTFQVSPFNGKADLAIGIRSQARQMFTTSLLPGFALLEQGLYTCCKLKYIQLFYIALYRNE